MKRLLYAAILCLLAILPANTRAQDSPQSSGAPYLYYFSSDIDAVVIERADGTDTRVLGADLVAGAAEEDKPYIFSSQQGWSPSGQWLAWQVTFRSHPYGGGNWKATAFVVNVDGRQHHSFTDDYYQIGMSWSPTDDVLAIWGQVNTYSEEGTLLPHEKSFFEIYDFEQDKVLFATDDLGSKFSITHFANVFWSPDGEHVILDTFDENPNFLVVTLDGQIDHIVPHNNPVVLSTVAGVPSTRISTTIANFDESRLVIEDIVTRETVTIEGISEKPDVFLLSPDQQKALIVQNGLWLWSSEDGLIQLLDRLQFVDLGYTFTNVAYWSPNSQYALIYGDISESRSTLWFIDANQQQVQDVLHIDEKTQYWFYPNWYWTADDQALVSGLLDATREADNYYRGYAYSALINFPTFDMQKFEFSPNPSPSSVAFDQELTKFVTVNEGPVIYDRTSDMTLVLRPDFDSYMSANGGLADMDESEEWLLTEEDGQVSSGGTRVGHAGVARVDGTHRRDLTGPEHFAEWLPPQVSIDNLPSPLSLPILLQPEQIIQTTNWSGYLSWSPDGERLAITQNIYFHEEGAEVYIWDFSAQSLTHFDHIDDPQSNEEGYLITWQVTDTNDDTAIPASPEGIGEWKYYQIRALSEQHSLVFIQEDFSTEYIFDLDRGEILHDITCYNSLYINNYRYASFSTDGTMLACHTGIFDVTTGEKVADIPVNGTAFAFSPDGTQLAVAASWDVLIYDVAELLEWKSAKDNFARYNP